MRPYSRLICLGIVAAFTLMPTVRAQDPPVTSGQASKDQTDKNDKNKKAAAQRDHLTKSQQNKLEKELANPYKVWLENDVPYIITDAERETFLKLSTNEERENFIENFWLRRDPTPDTPENEFKEEHFRRIAYANEHYRIGRSRAGKRTAAASTSFGANRTTSKHILPAASTTAHPKKAAAALPRIRLKPGRTTTSRESEITSSWNSWISQGRTNTS